MEGAVYLDKVEGPIAASLCPRITKPLTSTPCFPLFIFWCLLIVQHTTVQKFRAPKVLKDDFFLKKSCMHKITFRHNLKKKITFGDFRGSVQKCVLQSVDYRGHLPSTSLTTPSM